MQPGPVWARCQGIVSRLIGTLSGEVAGLVG
jgi:hypothetical protein